MSKKIALLSKMLSIGAFWLVLPIFMFFARLRFISKKILKHKPRVLFSFLGLPMSYLTARAVKSQNYPVGVYSLGPSSPFFKKLSWGYDLSQHHFLGQLLYLTDYLPLFLWAILFYDIFEFNFRGGILIYSRLQKMELFLLKILAKKIVIYGYGSDCKILADVKRQGKYNNAMDRSGKDENIDDNVVRGNLKRAWKYADVLIAGGDLIHFGPKGVFVPLAVDLDFWRPPQSARRKKTKIVNVIHSTNHRTHKGSRFIIKILKKLEEEKWPVRFILIEGKAREECRRQYTQGDIFITDVITGWHGYTAAEAMAMAKPVISYLRKDIFEFHQFYAKEIPIVSANPDTLKRTVIKLVKEPSLRKRLGERGLKYVLKYHSYEFVGQIYAIIYGRIWQGQKINQRILISELKKKKLI